MTAPLAPIPVPDVSPNVRAWLYFIAWILNSVGQLVTIVWVALAAALPEVPMPIWLVIASPALAFVTAQLHALAGGNLPSAEDVIEGDAPPPVEYDASRLRMRRRRR